MKYAKRDLELLIILSDNISRYMQGIAGAKGLCACLYRMGAIPGIFQEDIASLELIIEENIRAKVNPDYESGYGIYVWEEGYIEPRKKFLAELIEEIKNSLSD